MYTPGLDRTYRVVKHIPGVPRRYARRDSSPYDVSVRIHRSLGRAARETDRFVFKLNSLGDGTRARGASETSSNTSGRGGGVVCLSARGT